MYLYLLICLGLFAIGDFLGVITKARLSSVFVALLLFLIGFLTGAFPTDIIEQAGLTQVSRWTSPFVVFHMGTMINWKELKEEWRSVVLSIVAMGVAVVSIMAVIPLIGKEAAFVSIPIVNGGLIATQIMTDGALEKGMTLAAALGAFVYAIQKFVGTPPASIFGLREANALLKEHRAKKAAGTLEITQTAEAAEEASTKIPFYKKYEKYYTDFMCLGIVAVFAYISSLLQQMTSAWPISINISIWALLLGATIGYFGLVPPSILAVGKASGFMTMAIFASVIPSLASIDFSDLGTLGFQTVVIFAAVILGTIIFLYIIPLWKIVGSKDLSVGVAMAQLLGFPATYLIANEIATATAENEEEKQVVLKRIMPAYVVAGFVSVTTLSIIIAGIFVEFL